MNITKNEFGILLPAHYDDRRTLDEFNSDGQDFSIQYLTVGNSPKPLGNHFHKNKFEIFIILNGKGKYHCKKIDESGRMVTIEIVGKDIITVVPNTAHTFEMEPGSQIICISSKAFNENDKDIYSFDLIK